MIFNGRAYLPEYVRRRYRSLPDAQGRYPFPPPSAVGSIIRRYAATAAVELSGMLDDCHDDADLDEALQHFESLFIGGVVSPDEWHEAMMEVVAKARAAQGNAPACASPAANAMQFDCAWKRLSAAGKCDAIGGSEYRRVRGEWQTLGCPAKGIEQFIVTRANIMPTESEQ